MFFNIRINLEEEGAEAFSKALMNLKKLTILNLNLKDTMISNDGVKFLGKGLRSQTNLKNMELNLQQFFLIFFFFSDKLLVANLIQLVRNIWKNY